MHTVGEPAGVKVQGGLLEVITRAIEIECLPDEIPESFTVDVSELMIGQSKRASDVALAGSMKLVSAAGDRDCARGGAARRRGSRVAEAARRGRSRRRAAPSPK